MNFTSLLDLATSAGIPWLQVTDAVAKASLLLGAAGVASVALRRRTASDRHLVWTLALVGSLVVPALSMALPQWRVAVVTIPAALDQPPASNPSMTVDAPRRAPREQAGTSILPAASEPTASVQTGAPARPAGIQMI